MQVSNHDADYSWTVTSNAGSVAINGTGLITVTGLTPEQSATVTVTTSRTGYTNGSADVTGVADSESDECSQPYDSGLLDTDSDGVPNTCDGDDDNDGVPDTDEPAEHCALLVDCDGDGSIDAEDPYPLAVTRFALGAEAYIETFPSNPLSTCSLDTSKSLFSPYEAPDGMESIGLQASFSLEGCDANVLENVEVEVNFGQTLPVDGLVCKVEVGAEPVDMASASINDRSVRYSLRDNGPFDANPTPGVIDDPVTVLRVLASPPATSSPVPVPLHPLWSLIQLVLFPDGNAGAGSTHPVHGRKGCRLLGTVPWLKRRWLARTGPSVRRPIPPPPENRHASNEPLGRKQPPASTFWKPLPTYSGRARSSTLPRLIWGVGLG